MRDSVSFIDLYLYVGISCTIQLERFAEVLRHGTHKFSAPPSRYLEGRGAI